MGLYITLLVEFYGIRNNLMISLENYFNSSKNLSKNSLSYLNRNTSATPHRIAKCFNNPRPRYRSIQKCQEDQLMVNGYSKGRRSHYENMMKIIRNSSKFQHESRCTVSENQDNKATKYLKLNIERSKLKDHQKNKYSSLSKSENSDEVEEKDQLGKFSNHKIQNHQGQSNPKCKFSIKRIEFQKDGKGSKPKITILAKILNAKHLKQVRKIVESHAQIDRDTFIGQRQNSLELKCSRNALQSIKQAYEPDLRKSQNKGKLVKRKKVTDKKYVSKQPITGWTINDFAQ